VQCFEHSSDCVGSNYPMWSKASLATREPGPVSVAVRVHTGKAVDPMIVRRNAQSMIGGEPDDLRMCQSLQATTRTDPGHFALHFLVDRPMGAR
jgi:hypothetical protein